MSTYYALVCDTHRVVSGVIGERSLAARWWENSVGVLAAFLAEHADCRPGPELPLRLESNGRRVVVYEPECWGTETLPHGPVRMRRLDHVDGETNT
jgi:hypothetical protein